MSEILALGAVLVYVVVTVSMVCSVSAVFFAYRLSRITGRFGAWSLLIVALVLLAFEDLAFFGSAIFVSFSTLEGTVQSYTVGSWFLLFLILIAIPALFFASMFKLHQLFKAQSGQASSPAG